ILRCRMFERMRRSAWLGSERRIEYLSPATLTFSRFAAFLPSDRPRVALPGRGVLPCTGCRRRPDSGPRPPSVARPVERRSPMEHKPSNRKHRRPSPGAGAKAQVTDGTLHIRYHHQEGTLRISKFGWLAALVALAAVVGAVAFAPSADAAIL